jgi:DNA polymerase-3 subunit delta'
VNGNNLWRTIIGQDDAIDKLVRSLDAGGHTHALLFVGPRGIGKMTTAKVMAAILNCDDDGCGSCAICSKVLRDIHPDVILIEPEGNFILIEQIESLLQVITLKNYEGRTKVILIDDADRMTDEAANSLLKTLEEPPEHVVFILVTASIENVLPTIVSRCRLVRFQSIPAPQVTSFLIERYNAHPDEALLATRLSDGILGTAISFVMSPAKHARRKAIISAARSLDRAYLAQVSFVAEEFVGELKKPLEELKTRHKRELDELKEQFSPKDKPKQIINRLEDRHKRELSREEHQGYDDILTILVSWYRDVILVKETGRSDVLTNQDYEQAIREHADLLSSKDIYRCLQILEETKQYSRFNVNMQLAFETMLFKIHDVVAVQNTPYIS